MGDARKVRFELIDGDEAADQPIECSRDKDALPFQPQESGEEKQYAKEEYTNLLLHSKIYGYSILTCSDGFYVKGLNDTPSWVAVEGVVSASLSSDELRFAIATIDSVSIYDVRNLEDYDELGCQEDEELKSIEFHPKNPDLLMVVWWRGWVEIWNITDSIREPLFSIGDTVVTAAGWSFDGTEVLIGNEEGGVSMYSSDLQLKWSVESLIDENELEEDLRLPRVLVCIVAVQAGSYAVSFDTVEGDDDVVFCGIYDADAGVMYCNNDTFCQEVDKTNNIIITSIPEWNIVVMSACNDRSLAYWFKNTENKWELIIFEETGRPQAALSEIEEDEDTYVMGLAVDYSSTEPVLLRGQDDPIPPQPHLLVYSSDCVLTSWTIANTQSDTQHPFMKAHKQLPSLDELSLLLNLDDEEPPRAVSIRDEAPSSAEDTDTDDGSDQNLAPESVAGTGFGKKKPEFSNLKHDESTKAAVNQLFGATNSQSFSFATGDTTEIANKGSSPFGGLQSAFGTGTTAFGGTPNAFGTQATSQATAFGGQSNAFSQASPFGHGSAATGEPVKGVFGTSKTAFGATSTASGGETSAFGAPKSAMGDKSAAYGPPFGGQPTPFSQASAFGNKTTTSNGQATAFGQSTGGQAHPFGGFNTALSSTPFGQKTQGTEPSNQTITLDTEKASFGDTKSKTGGAGIFGGTKAAEKVAAPADDDSGSEAPHLNDSESGSEDSHSDPAERDGEYEEDDRDGSDSANGDGEAEAEYKASQGSTNQIAAGGFGGFNQSSMDTKKSAFSPLPNAFGQGSSLFGVKSEATEPAKATFFAQPSSASGIKTESSKEAPKGLFASSAFGAKNEGPVATPTSIVSQKPSSFGSISATTEQTQKGLFGQKPTASGFKSEATKESPKSLFDPKTSAFEVKGETTQEAQKLGAGLTPSAFGIQNQVAETSQKVLFGDKQSVFGKSIGATDEAQNTSSGQKQSAFGLINDEAKKPPSSQQLIQSTNTRASNSDNATSAFSFNEDQNKAGESSTSTATRNADDKSTSAFGEFSPLKEGQNKAGESSTITATRNTDAAQGILSDLRKASTDGDGESQTKGAEVPSHGQQEQQHQQIPSKPLLPPQPVKLPNDATSSKSSGSSTPLLSTTDLLNELVLRFETEDLAILAKLSNSIRDYSVPESEMKDLKASTTKLAGTLDGVKKDLEQLRERSVKCKEDVEDMTMKLKTMKLRRQKLESSTYITANRDRGLDPDMVREREIILSRFQDQQLLLRDLESKLHSLENGGQYTKFPKRTRRRQAPAKDCLYQTIQSQHDTIARKEMQLNNIEVQMHRLISATKVMSLRDPSADQVSARVAADLTESDLALSGCKIPSNSRAKETAHRLQKLGSLLAERERNIVISKTSSYKPPPPPKNGSDSRPPSGGGVEQRPSIDSKTRHVPGSLPLPSPQMHATNNRQGSSPPGTPAGGYNMNATHIPIRNPAQPTGPSFFSEKSFTNTTASSSAPAPLQKFGTGLPGNQPMTAQSAFPSLAKPPAKPLSTGFSMQAGMQPPAAKGESFFRTSMAPGATGGSGVPSKPTSFTAPTTAPDTTKLQESPKKKFSAGSIKANADEDVPTLDFDDNLPNISTKKSDLPNIPRSTVTTGFSTSQPPKKDATQKSDASAPTTSTLASSTGSTSAFGSLGGDKSTAFGSLGGDKSTAFGSLGGDKSTAFGSLDGDKSTAFGSLGGDKSTSGALNASKSIAAPSGDSAFGSFTVPAKAEQTSDTGVAAGSASAASGSGNLTFGTPTTDASKVAGGGFGKTSTGAPKAVGGAFGKAPTDGTSGSAFGSIGLSAAAADGAGKVGKPSDTPLTGFGASKGTNAFGVSNATAFGTSTGASPFAKGAPAAGTASAAGGFDTSKPAVSATPSVFGAPATGATGGAFGTSGLAGALGGLDDTKTAEANTNSSSGFGFGKSATPSTGFGSSAFGASTTNTGAFGSGSTSSGFGTSSASGSAANGTTAPTGAFGSAQSGAGGAFGASSGASAFGQAAKPTAPSTGGAFGQTTQPSSGGGGGFGSSAFGGGSAFGASTKSATTSAFGSTGAFGSASSGTPASAFGSGAPAASGGAFGSSATTGAGGFGSGTGSGTGASAFGTPSGGGAFGATGGGSSAFGSSGGTSAFGTSGGASAFGTGGGSGAFGSGGGTSAFGASAFGTSSASAGAGAGGGGGGGFGSASAFGSTPQKPAGGGGGFGGFGAAAAGGSGGGFGALATNSSGGFGGTGSTPASVTPQKFGGNNFTQARM